MITLGFFVFLSIALTVDITNHQIDDKAKTDKLESKTEKDATLHEKADYYNEKTDCLDDDLNEQKNEPKTSIESEYLDKGVPTHKCNETEEDKLTVEFIETLKVIENAKPTDETETTKTSKVSDLTDMHSKSDQDKKEIVSHQNHLHVTKDEVKNEISNSLSHSEPSSRINQDKDTYINDCQNDEDDVDFFDTETSFDLYDFRNYDFYKKLRFCDDKRSHKSKKEKEKERIRKKMNTGKDDNEMWYSKTDCL